MPATSLQELVDTIGAPMVLNLLDHDNDGVADANLVAQVLSAADSDLRVVIGRAYTAEEFAKAGEDLTNLATQVAIYHAYLKRPEVKDSDGNTPWEAERERAMKTAQSVASGTARIDRDGSLRSGPQNATGYVRSTDRYFLDGTGDF